MTASSTSPVDWARVRAQFPALHQTIHDKPLVYLDSAASSQMPQRVIDALVRYHSLTHSNVHRGVHTLSQRATNAYEEARQKVQAFINAPSLNECIYVRGATEGLNLVANSWGRQNLREGDRVLVSQMEHHANIVPWQMVARDVGATVEAIPITDEGELDMQAFESMLDDRVKVVGCVHVSNALGTINPVAKLAKLADSVGAIMVVDGCQAAPHMQIDVQALGVDFYTFSGHKMYAPTGIGVLWGREALLEKMPPWQGGGDMIDRVSFDGTTFAELPTKFEAGTPSIDAAVGLGEAIDFLMEFEPGAIAAREHALLVQATQSFEQAVPSGRIVGRAADKAAVMSFVIDGVHPHDIGTILDSCGVAVRSGQHCAEPVMDRLGVPATARASFGVYSNEDDIARLMEALEVTLDLFG